MIGLKNLTTLPINIFEEHILDDQQTYVPFAWTETFLLDIEKQSHELLLHIWPMKKTVILGMLDKRLPYLARGQNVIRHYGYEQFVRNIGGLAVVADEGILNFSLFIPNTFEEKISISDAYMIMVDLVKAVFTDYQQEIEQFEVVGSYCPGDYDLSINGKKFAGIAQRRVKKGIVVSIYLSVCGDQQLRGQMIADFYQQGLQNQPTNRKYPSVNPDCMANLSELLGVMSLSVQDVIERIKSTLTKIGFDIVDLEPSEQQREAFQNFYSKIESNQRKI